jgi:cytochrome b subunit of formate dehydrogenase
MASQTRTTGTGQSRRRGFSAFGLVGRSIGLVFTLMGRLLLAIFLIAEAIVNGIGDLFSRPAKARPAVKVKEESVVRFDVHQRIQHILMFTTFITLAVTGLPQKLHYWDVSQGFIALMGGLEMVQRIHRIAGFMMLFDCVYHGIYVVYTVGVRRQLGPLQMIPTPKDMRDAFQMFRYFFGLSDEKPRFGRFSYLEKFDYWAVFWGIAVIGGSGLILTFPVEVSRIVPGGIVPVAHAAHSDEALLAVGWIFIVHFFYAHFAPAVFPFNTSIFSGRVTKHYLAEEHPLEYEKLFQEPADNHHEPDEQATKLAVAARVAAGEADRQPDEHS